MCHPWLKNTKHQLDLLSNSANNQNPTIEIHSQKNSNTYQDSNNLLDLDFSKIIGRGPGHAKKINYVQKLEDEDIR